MGLPADKILSEALDLSKRDRAMVAEQLIESLEYDEPTELSPEWREEILRRCKEIDEGTADLEDAEAVFARLYASLDE